MANRFIGGVLSSRPQANTPFSSRASTGTYFDSTGTLVTAPANQPRLNYNFVGSTWTQPTVLIEPATTNIVSYSQDFSQASYWGPNNSTIGSAAGTTPDGTNTAFKIQENTSNNVHGVEQQLGDTNGRAYTLSIFAKAAERNWLIIDNTHQGVANYRNWFNLSTGVVGTMNGSNSHLTMTPVGNGWYRCSVTRQAGTLGSHRICIYASTGDGTVTYTGTSGSGILIWGCQLEYQLGMTSYITSPSTGVGTRAADVVGPYSTGIYGLYDRQNSTANDDQFTVQTFTTTGSSTWTAPLDVTSVEVLVVAGGGGGGNAQGGGGGGGAGGLLYNVSYPVTPGTTYPVIVGAGGAGGASGQTAAGTNGQNSQFGALIAIGGGAGSAEYANGVNGRTGGSGGGNCYSTATSGAPGITGQGFPGGLSSYVNGSGYEAGGGGGGAGGPGMVGINTGTASTSVGGNGGPGLYFNISGTNTVYAGGGGGAANSNTSPGISIGGSGIGGGGGRRGGPSGGNGTVNTGSGGGGGGTDSSAGGSGGSGIVVVKYKRTPKQISSTSNAAIVTQKFTRTISAGWTAPAGVTQVEALVVAGGGGAGSGAGTHGAGAGGVIYNSAFSVTPGSTYTVTVGAGGAGGIFVATNVAGSPGGNSVFGSLTAIGGGASGADRAYLGANGNGGSGAGGGGTGTAGQGNNGGAASGYGSPYYPGSGGGGAGGVGLVGWQNSNNSTARSGDGGPGLPFNITGNLEYYAGGGAGSINQADTASIVSGRGGIGGGGNAIGNGDGQSGAPNTGGGGAGGGYSGNYKSGGAGGSGVIVIRYRVPQIATFLDSGAWTCPAGVTSVQALVVAGGGGGGPGGGGGGGAGGVIYNSAVAVTSGVTYSIVVGQGGSGGAGGIGQGTNGANSSFANLIAIGGGYGATSYAGTTTGATGGSGGGGTGAAGGSTGSSAVGSGTYGQGNSGGVGYCLTGNYVLGGGGGGAGQAGFTYSGTVAGNGGAGLAYSISGSSTTYGGGGGGGIYVTGTAGSGGAGGGGAGANGAGTSGTANTGGGGGGSNYSSNAGAGGSGIVILRWSGA